MVHMRAIFDLAPRPPHRLNRAGLSGWANPPSRLFVNLSRRIGGEPGEHEAQNRGKSSV
jgi:hypothetical protein